MVAMLPVLAQDALTDWVSWTLAVGSLIALIRSNCNPTWVIGVGAVVGAARGLG